MRKSKFITLIIVGTASVAMLYAGDPCLSIAGSWAGQDDDPAFNIAGQYLGQCRDNDSVNVVSYQTVVSMTGNTSPIGCTFPAKILPGKINMSGTCQNAQLNLNQGVFHGVVINGQISLNWSHNGHGGSMTLHKTGAGVMATKPIKLQQRNPKKARRYYSCKKSGKRYSCNVV